MDSAQTEKPGSYLDAVLQVIQKLENQKVKEYLQNRYERSLILIKCTIRKLAQKYHTPLYIFSEKEIRQQCHKLKSAIIY
ncbi:MAG: hypothetical protein P8Y70_02520, partial [Candidatus Lokiarchaeota archaeon]